MKLLINHHQGCILFRGTLLMLSSMDIKLSRKISITVRHNKNKTRYISFNIEEGNNNKGEQSNEI